MQSMIEKPLSFRSQKEWSAWLSKNHTRVEGIWLRLYKKASGVTSVNHDQALDSVLCYGWIDGQTKPFDKDSWIQKFTPRRAKSLWSKRNIEHTERLIKTKKMRAPGMREIERAKSDGRWHAAYDSPSKVTIPEDFLIRLSKNKKALAFFKSLNKTNRYSIAWRLQTAIKPQTREKRMETILAMMRERKKFH